jgi:addiction module HigA family antidote
MLKIEGDLPPLSQGAVLQEHIVGRLGISQAALAKALGVSRFTVSQVLGGRRAVSTEMALRLGHVLDTSPELWLKLQAQVDLFEARRGAGAESRSCRGFGKLTRRSAERRRNKVQSAKTRRHIDPPSPRTIKRPGMCNGS